MENIKSYNQTSANRILALLIFLLSPLLAVVVAAKQYREVWAKNIVWLFAAYYGFTFVIGNQESDVNRYKVTFEELAAKRLGLGQFIDSLFTESKLDFLHPIINYVVSLFSNNFRVALLTYGIIMGFFLSRNIWNVINSTSVAIKYRSLFFIIPFCFVFAVWDINVLRFSVAAHIFFYGAFGVLVKKKNSAWIFVFLSMLMHFTFSLPIGVLILYKFVGNRTTIFFVLYCLSFMVSEINLGALKSNLTFLPESYREHSEGYINEDYQQERQKLTEQKNFRGKFYQPAIKWSMAILLILVFFKRKEWLVQEKTWYGYFSFVLLYFGIFNILSVIPVMHRFLFVGYLFSLSLLFIYFQHAITKADRIALKVAVPVLMFYFVVKFRIGFEFTGLFTLLGGPITALFNEGDIPLIDLLR